MHLGYQSVAARPSPEIHFRTSGLSALSGAWLVSAWDAPKLLHISTAAINHPLKYRHFRTSGLSARYGFGICL